MCSISYRSARLALEEGSDHDSFAVIVKREQIVGHVVTLRAV